jgi:metal-responsive CopG/Arc/MetJ family transcriptional regulator
VAAGTVRTTLALPSDLLEATDRAVREGKARSRNELVATALRRELAARRRAEIDAELAEMANDPDYRREAAQIMADFAEADAETARMLDAEYGPYADDEAALAATATAEPRLSAES